jgi:hypothetical protein
MASAVFDDELKLDKTQVGFIFSAFAQGLTHTFARIGNALTHP